MRIDKILKGFFITKPVITNLYHRRCTEFIGRKWSWQIIGAQSSTKFFVRFGIWSQGASDGGTAEMQTLPFLFIVITKLAEYWIQ